MKFLSILLVSLFSVGNFSFADPIVKEEKISFSIKKGFSNVNGRFSKTNYSIVLNSDGSGTISGTADIASVSTGNKTRDKHLQNKEWFDAANHPQINIQSKKIVNKNEGEYIGTFDIKIKGKTEIKEIPFKVVTNQNGKVLNATFTLSIGTFDIGGGIVDVLVGDKVTVNLQLPF